MKKIVFHIKNFLVNLSILRLVLIPVLKKLNFEFRWKHDLTNRPFFLQSYYHKGYWFYGQNREKDELDFFQKFIVRGDNVLEVGTHIGYLTQYFEHLVSDSGKVLAIEPTPYSLSYLQKNVLPSTIIIEKAASNNCGQIDFYIEDFGGFTNSIIGKFTQSQNEYHEKSQHIYSKVKSIKVNTDTLDSICSENNFLPNFIKIDVEGAEYDVLKGAKKILKNTNALMVEISKNKHEVFDILANSGFKCLAELKNSNNFFFVKNDLAKSFALF